MKLTKRGNLWWVDFRTPEGRRRRVSTGIKVGGPSEKAAARTEAGRLVAIECAAGAAPPALMMLGDALERTYLQHWGRTRSAVVMRRTVDVIKRGLGGLTIEGTTYGALKDYCEARLAEGLAPATVNRRMSAVGVALREEARRRPGYRRPDLPNYPENNRKERYMSPEEETKVFGWLSTEAAVASARSDGVTAAAWDYVLALATLLLDTGMRFSEAYKFTSDGTHIDLKHGETKTGAGRRIPLTTRAQRASRRLHRRPSTRRWRPCRPPRRRRDGIGSRTDGCARSPRAAART